MATERASLLRQLGIDSRAWSSTSPPTDAGDLRRKAGDLAQLLGAVRQANRTAAESAAEGRAQVAARRQAAEHAQLRLASLRAERAQLRAAIAACRRFRAIYPTISLHTEDEFEQLRAKRRRKSPEAGASQGGDADVPMADAEGADPRPPEEGPSKPETEPKEETKADPKDAESKDTPEATATEEETPHDRMIARLQFELEERRRLEKVRLGLQAERMTATSATKQRKAELLRLEQDIQSVMRVSRPFYLYCRRMGQDEC